MAATEVPRSDRFSFDAGDPLRAIAALSVVAYHYAFDAARSTGHPWFTDAFGPAFGRLLSSLELGLYLFFVLSGYLIAAPFVRALLGHSPVPRAGRYAINRALRIVPAFWVVLTCFLVAHGTFGAEPWEIVAIYGFAQTYAPSTASLLVGPAWTLGIEVAFYAAVPLAAWLLLRVRPRYSVGALLTIVGGIWVASLVLRLAVSDDLMWLRSPPAMLWAFMPGVALACIEAHLVAAKVRPPRPAALATGLAVGGGLACVAYAATAPRAFPPLPGVAPALLATLGSGALVAAPLVLQWGARPTPAVLRARLLHWLGQRSYGIYLVHQGLLLTVGAWFATSVAPGLRLAQLLLAGVPVAVLAAAVLYVLVERPVLRRRPRWRAPALRHAEEAVS